MNPLDIGVIAIIVLSAIFAFARGFVREALSIVAWVGAAAVTVYGFVPVLAMVDPIVKNPLLSQLIAGFGLFVGALIVLTILTSFVARMVRASALSPIDRTLGFVFGLARGALIVCLAYLLLDISVQPGERPAWIREAKERALICTKARTCCASSCLSRSRSRMPRSTRWCGRSARPTRRERRWAR